jgi:hypothetical protein
MNRIKFNEVINNTPFYLPYFKLVRVPEWCKRHGLKKGDLFYYEHGSFADCKQGSAFGIGPSYFKFVEYRQV